MAKTELHVLIANQLALMSDKTKLQLDEQARLHHLSPLQIRILLYLQKQEQLDIKASDLSAAFLLSKPTISVALKPMVVKSLIHLRKSSSDSRAKHLSLTERGQQIATIAGYYQEPLLRIIKTIKTTEKELLLKLLMGINAKLEEQ